MSEGTGTSRPAWWWQALVVALALGALLLRSLYSQVAGKGILEGDGIWHLTVGRIISERGEVPRADPICFATDGIEWINMSWFSDWLNYQTYLALGFDGVLGLCSLLVAIALLATWVNLRGRKVSPVPALLVLAYAVAILGLYTSTRTRLYSYAFVACVACVLSRPDPERRLSWQAAGALLVLQALWINLHGAWLIGYALLGADCLGSAWESGREGKGWAPVRARWLAGVGLLSAFVGFGAHPHGSEVLGQVLRLTATHGNTLESVRNMDRLPLPLASVWGVSVLVFLALAGLALYRRRGRFRLTEFALAGVLFFACFAWRRLLPHLVLVVGPFVASLWSDVLDEQEGARGRIVEALRKRTRVAVAAFPLVLGGAALAWTLFVITARARPGVPGQLTSAFDSQRLPVEAALALKRSGLPGRVYCGVFVGGLLGWVLYPERRVFIDGRTDIHMKNETLRDVISIAGQWPGWAERFEVYDFEWAVVERGGRLGAALRERGFDVFHQDAAFTLFRRRHP